MRAIENALGLPAGATDDFMAGKIDRLTPKGTSSAEGPGNVFARDDVERAMLEFENDVPPEVLWAHVVEHRQRVADKAVQKSERMRQSG
jgi:hypothetical protein